MFKKLAEGCLRDEIFISTFYFFVWLSSICDYQLKTSPPLIKLDKAGILDKFLDKFYVFMDKFLLF